MTTSTESPYSQWSTESLIQRVTALEKELQEINIKYKIETKSEQGLSAMQPETPSATRSFDRSKYATRHVALKFAYLGSNYNGFEHAVNNTTPLPTIEETVWKALMKARLIFPDDESLTENDTVSWDGCQYSKCGRTDRGVSAFGQVIGVRMRSNRPQTPTPGTASLNEDNGNERAQGPHVSPPHKKPRNPFSNTSGGDESSDWTTNFHAIDDEIPYPQVMNRLLPPDIRVLAWCPFTPDDFSARFSCRERRYRYFFTQPAFSPSPGGSGLASAHTFQSTSETRKEGWLDIELMKKAARQFEGFHDFRNFCKIDPSKQIRDFRRRIFHSEIRELDASCQPGAYVSDSTFSEFPSDLYSATQEQRGSSSLSSAISPKLYVFELNGSAFLWHQVRHMMAILFLVGQGLEDSSVVSHLLDTEICPEKPIYNMAEDAPLVLWDCIFPQEGSEDRTDSLNWVYSGDGRSKGKFGTGGLVDDTWALWRQKKIEEVLAGSLLNVVARHGDPLDSRRADTETQTAAKQRSQRVFQGGNVTKARGKYVPIMKRERMECAEAINQRYALRKGLDARVQGQGKDSSTLVWKNRRDHEALTR